MHAHGELMVTEPAECRPPCRACFIERWDRSHHRSEPLSNGLLAETQVACTSRKTANPWPAEGCHHTTGAHLTSSTWDSSIQGRSSPHGQDRLSPWTDQRLLGFVVCPGHQNTAWKDLLWEGQEDKIWLQIDRKTISAALIEETRQRYSSWGWVALANPIGTPQSATRLVRYGHGVCSAIRPIDVINA